MICLRMMPLSRGHSVAGRPRGLYSSEPEASRTTAVILQRGGGAPTCCGAVTKGLERATEGGEVTSPRHTARETPPEQLDQEAEVSPAVEREADIAAQQHGSALFRAMLDARPEGETQASDD
jgi:hypothetical protein